MVSVRSLPIFYNTSDSWVRLTAFELDFCRSHLACNLKVYFLCGLFTQHALIPVLVFHNDVGIIEISKIANQGDFVINP